MATKQELGDHLKDCSGYRVKTLRAISKGFEKVNGEFTLINNRLDEQDKLLVFVGDSQTLYNSSKRILGLLFSALGLIATVFEAMRGLGLLSS